MLLACSLGGRWRVAVGVGIVGEGVVDVGVGCGWRGRWVVVGVSRLASPWALTKVFETVLGINQGVSHHPRCMHSHLSAIVVSVESVTVSSAMASVTSVGLSECVVASSVHAHTLAIGDVVGGVGGVVVGGILSACTPVGHGGVGVVVDGVGCVGGVSKCVGGEVRRVYDGRWWQ